MVVSEEALTPRPPLPTVGEGETDKSFPSPSQGKATGGEVSSRPWWRLPGERTLFALLLAGAAFVRLAGAGQVEPNLSTIEVSHLATVESLLLGRNAGLLGWTGGGASGLALVPAALLRLVRPEP